ncbi:MAG: peptidoglycan-binding protein [Rhodobacteraceae bacterium]|nr:peptidoglycan-binding protein [Paracoccaceae bacterium]
MFRPPSRHAAAFPAKLLLAAGLSFGSLISGDPAWAEGLCEAPAQSCASVMPATCVDRVGAAALPTTEDANCGSHLESYRACLTTVISACEQEKETEPRHVTLPAGDMLAIWNEVKDSGDADALEAFAEDFKGASLGVLAAKRAKELRAQELSDTEERKAQQVWSHLKDVDDPEVLEAFAKEFEGTEQAAFAAAAAKELRDDTDQRGVKRQKWSENAPPAPQTAVSSPSPEEIAAAERAAAKAAERAARNRAAQADLNRLGYDAGLVDGDFGRKSQAALAAFQRAQGIEPADGRLTKPVLAALSAAPTPEPSAPAAPLPVAAAPEPQKTAAAPEETARAPEQFQAEISWSFRRGFEESFGSCETPLIAAGAPDADGLQIYAAEEQRCQSDNITYNLKFDPASNTIKGALQIFAFEGRSPKFTVQGQLPSMSANFQGANMRITLSQP